MAWSLNTNTMNHLFTALLLIMFGLFGSCNEHKTRDLKSTRQESKAPAHLIRIIQPINGTMFSLGEQINISLKQANDAISPDSIVLYINNKREGTIVGLAYTLRTNSLPLGSCQVRATAWRNGERQTASAGIRIKANQAPKRLQYKIVNTFPHDITAYTQGLFYHNGFLIESTGQNGLSSLRRVEVSSGKVIQSVNLERQFFGEGATIINNEIYQITWTSRRGFVYNPETFSLIRTFDYQTQGWGLTTLGDKLVMSDGSHVLYILEPKSFSEIKRVEVYNDRGPVTLLNELECINGKIYANIYQSNTIVIIDPNTGMVEGEIDFTSILTQNDKHKNIDVFNGIAWDAQRQRLFVTGKNWPKLFEVNIY